MEQSPWEANCLSANWGISCTIGYVKLHHHMDKSQPLISLVHTMQSCCLKIHFNFIVSSVPRPSKWSLSFRFPSPKPVCTSLPHSCHMPCSSHSSWFRHPTNIWWAVQIMKLLTVLSHPVLCYLIPLSPKYLPQYPILKHSQSIFCAKCDRPRFTPI